MSAMDVPNTLTAITRSPLVDFVPVLVESPQEKKMQEAINDKKPSNLILIVFE
jgi:hypothetical protein